MLCTSCQFKSPPDFDFCPKCGIALRQICAQCGFEVQPNFAFCPKCGSPLASPSREAVSGQGSEPMVARLQRLVPAEYAERLLVSRGQVGHERRTVTILFSDVKGSTALAEGLDPEEVMELMDGAFDLLIKPVYHYEGTVARLMGDAVLAFFGAPIAHEDDPERAIRAALEITAGAQRYAERLERERGLTGFGVRVGINTGLVVVGEVGSDLRVEYTAMGDAVNLAARMEQNAPPGGILITHDTYRHVRGVFDVLAQEPLLVKGRSEAVQTYLVERAKPRAFRRPSRGVEGIETRMVGREAELKLLQEALLAAIEDGELQAVTISGEAGVGKSRLLHEFDAWAELLPEPFFYFKGRASAEMQNQPYGLIRDLIAFRFQIQDSDSASGVREKLEEGVRGAWGGDEDSDLEPQVSPRAHLIGHLVGFEVGDSPLLAGVRDDPQSLRDQALAHLTAYFQDMARQSPVLILLEDLHWADDSSLDALNHLALVLHQQPLLIVSATRPELFDRRPHWGEGQGFHRRLALEPLSRWDSRRLVAEILRRVDQVPDALRDLIVARTEGNPFFIEEMVKMLVEEGVIVKGEDAWRVLPSRLAGVRVPPTLTGVLQARLDRLPLEERTILQQSSVVGRLFWDRAVARINASAEAGISEAGIVDSLAALRGREMVFQRETSAFADAQEYIFKHGLLREVTYESVLWRVRRAYHGLVADWLLEQARERAEEYTSLVADHLALAGRTQEAVEYLLQAGDRARGLYAHQEAIHAYERALTLLKERGDDEQAARTLMKLGLAYHNAFQFQQSRRAYDEAFAQWQQAAVTEPAIAPAPAPHALRMVWYRGGVLDPGMEATIAGGWIEEQLFCGLLAEDPNLDIAPDVARSWEVSDGGRRYIFHLRDDVYWSDGVPVTAGDFSYAWKRVLDPATGSPNAELLYDVLGARAFHQREASHPDQLGVRALNDLTLEVELEEPTGHFLQLLSHDTTFPVPRHVVEVHGASWTEVGRFVSNGPFRLEARPSDELLMLVRNPAYHGRTTGNLERVEISLQLSRESASALLAAYEADDLDLYHPWELPISDMDRARQQHPGEFVSEPWLHTHYLVFNTNRPPFDDVRVRRAFVQAMDRETLAGVALGGFVFPATGGLVPPGMAGHSPGIALQYDPQEARRLLAEAGYPDGHGFPPIVCATLLATVQKERGEYLRQAWQAELGVQVREEVIEFGTTAVRQDRELPDLFFWGWVADYPDPDNYLRVALASMPTKAWRNPTYEQLVEKARRLTDQRQRMRLYGQADRILVEEAAIGPLFYPRNSFLIKPWVRRFPMSVRGGWFWKDVIIDAH
jgi:ABC-type oligopeptide transport system substrate-binding subunit/class 3 adenylate cyclase/tetratricopeptide (TPR) repeat protein